MSEPRPPAHTAARSRVVAWALWDCGSTGVSAIVVTFVFSVYLTGSVGDDLPGGTSPASCSAGRFSSPALTVALLAPVTGVWVDAAHRRRRTLAVLTAMVVLPDIGDEPDPRRLPLPVGWPSAARVHRGVQRPGQRPVQRDAATADDTGDVRPCVRIRLGRRLCRQHGVACLSSTSGFIAGDGPTAGLLDIPTADGQNVRAAMLVAAAWLAVFALPVLIVHAACRHRTAGTVVDRCARRLPQALVGPDLRVEARPQCRLLPARQRGVPGRIGRRLHLRRGAGRDRLRHLRGRRAAVRCQRQRGGRGGGGDRRAARRPDRLEDRHPGLAGGDDRRGPDPDGVVRCRGVLGVRPAAVPVHRADAVVGADTAAANDRQGKEGWRSASTP